LGIWAKTYRKVDPIKPTRKYAQRLRRRQQTLSRKTKGSNNRKKQVKRVAKVHGKIANTRQDFLHKISRELVDENQVIVVENLCIKGLARTKLAKSVFGCWIWDVAQFPGLQTRKRGRKID
jgi:Probable transposase.